MKLAAVITCNDYYVKLAIVALKCFQNKNIQYDMFIFGKMFSSESYDISQKYNIRLLTTNLENDFYDLDNGGVYPIECFYHLYAYKILPEYDFIVTIEPDICTNKKLDLNLNDIEFVAGSFCHNIKIHDFCPIINDLDKIKTIYNDYDVNQNRIIGGFRIYNVKNLNKIKFYETIVEYYQNSLKIGAPRRGDDSLMVMYQLLNKDKVYLLQPQYHIVFYNQMLDVNNIYHFHFTGPNEKYWKQDNRQCYFKDYFRNKMIDFLFDNFDSEFIEKTTPFLSNE
jgi:hypothetical protein